MYVSPGSMRQSLRIGVERLNRIRKKPLICSPILYSTAGSVQSYTDAAEFGNSESVYRAAEEQAKERKVGMWSKPGLIQRLAGAKSKAPESPREYKARHTAAEKQKKT